MSIRVFVVCLCAVLTCRVVGASSSQSFKNCPTKPVQANFNFTRFQGLWYELRRQPNAFEPDSVCVTGDVAVTPQGGLTIVNRWYNTV
ncbi:unnamed protein product [Timema podura]|uniref:Lipocalin/cytosolic fatty-acid binding domain-containing protein n=1 Tax=Timema podura TaxID=61482 RepID=A0ABN7P4C4_TIMPD|nr:unnamed protein product [Timema podura]